MKRLLVFCALAAMTFAAASQALKAADYPCPRGNETLHGTYISLHPTGYVVGVGPITANGTITFDGRGNATNTFSVSINGAIQRGVVHVGPYTVNPDCTATLDLSGANFDMVVLPDGSRFSWVEVDPGIVLSGESVRFSNE
jgi:hypothetical protein